MDDNQKTKIGLFSLTMIAVGSSIGSGIFRAPSDIARYLPSEGLMLMVWAVGGLIAVCGALTFARISAENQQSGGFYAFLRSAFGDLPAFLFGWSMLIVVNTGSLAALSLIFTDYLSSFIPLNETAKVIIAILTIAALTLMNVVGIKFGSLYASIFTSAKLIGILLVIFLGLFFGSNAEVSYFNTNFAVKDLSLVSAFGLALIGVTFSFGGYQHVTFVAGEVKDAAKIVPKALVMGILIVCVAYLTINVAYLRFLPIEQIAASKMVASDAINTIWGFGGKFISFLIILSVVGTIGIYILTAPRIYFAMAEDGLFFKKFAEIHPKYQTPFWAIIFQSAWTIFLLILLKTFTNLISFVVFVDTSFFLLAAATYFFLVKRKTIFGSLCAIVFIAMSAFIVINTLIEQTSESLTGIIFLVIGTGVYFIFKYLRK